MNNRFNRIRDCEWLNCLWHLFRPNGHIDGRQVCSRSQAMMHRNALLNSRWRCPIKGTGALVLGSRKFSTSSCCNSPASVAGVSQQEGLEESKSKSITWIQAGTQ